MTVTAAHTTGSGRREVRDVLGNRVLGAHLSDTDIGSFTGFGESIVARVEIFTLLGGHSNELLKRI